MKAVNLVNRAAVYSKNGQLIREKSAAIPSVAPHLQNLRAGTRVKTLASAIHAVAAQHQDGTPISFDAFDAAEIMGVTRDEASLIIQSMKSEGLLREERDYALGCVLGYSLDGAARRR